MLDQVAQPEPVSRDYLAVGCLWFAADAELASDATAFFEALKAALTSVENISDVRIEGADSNFGSQINLPDRADGESLSFPHLYDVEVYYRLHIPFKLQEEIGFKCNSEEFELFTVLHYHFPVTYIPRTVTQDQVEDGTVAIALVREYLKRKLTAGDIKPFYYGPSPFHASFEARESDAWIAIQDNTEEPGYKEYVYHYSREGNYIYPFIMERANLFSILLATSPSK